MEQSALVKALAGALPAALLHSRRARAAGVQPLLQSACGQSQRLPPGGHLQRFKIKTGSRLIP
ncbi:MAG: hypothetical protein IT168_10695 [Bryobacterales bacterium]|nr:hypothetical protein [Bryobacterales bacterium]